MIIILLITQYLFERCHVTEHHVNVVDYYCNHHVPLGQVHVETCEIREHPVHIGDMGHILLSN